MHRRHPRHQRRIGDKGAQVIGADDLHPVALRQNRRIIPRAAQHVGAVRSGQGSQCRAKVAGRHLGPAGPAHRLVAHRLLQPLGTDGGQGRGRHRRIVAKHRHEAPVNPVLPPPQPAPFQPKAQLVRHRPLAAQRDQLQIVALRMIGPHPPLSAQRHPQVVIEKRRLAHRKDPGLGARRVGQMRTIARGKDRRVQALQRRPHGDKALMRVDPDFGQPTLRAAARHRQCEIGWHPAAIGQRNVIGVDRRDLGPGLKRHAIAGQGGQQRSACAGADMGQGGVCALQQGHGRARPRCPQPMRRGHRQLGPAHTRADDRYLRRRPARGHKCLPPPGIIAQGFGGHAMRGIAGDLGQLRADADVDAGNVIGDRRAIRQDHPPRRAVNADSPAQNHPRAGVSGQLHKVDHDLRVRVVPGDHPRQHARVGRDRVGIDHRDPHTGQRFHCPHPQQQGMGVPTPHQHQILHQRPFVPHRLSPILQLPPPYRYRPRRASEQKCRIRA